MWLLKLLLCVLTASVTPLDCGVTPEWESELVSGREANRDLSTSTAFSRSSTLGPLRIVPYYMDMSQLSPALLTRVQQVIMPSVLSWFANVLSVYNLNQNWVLPQTTCGTQTVPSAHQTTGVSGADIVIYVFAENDSVNSYVARAGACAFDGGTSRGSPIAGTFQYNPVKYTSSLTVENEISLARHEISHILAFAGSLFTKYTKPDGTLYANPVVSATMRGTTVSFLTTPTVVAKTQAAFGCSTIPGLEIEKLGGQGTAGSHPETRILFNDYMNGALMSEPIYSDVTLAAFQDSGWYTVNFAFTDQIKFGKGKGCSFLTTQCVVSGVAQFPEFCAATNTKMCDLYNSEKATCAIGTYTAALPTEYQYFSNPMQGGTDTLADYCPYAAPYSNGDCKGRGTSTTLINASTLGEKVCDTCMCFTGTYILSGWSMTGDPNHTGCHQVTCANGVATVTIGTVSIQCPAAGGQVSTIPGYTGFINCPSYDQLCGPGVCPNGCFGYGTCVNGACVCLDGYSGIDCSTICDSSCKTCSGTSSTQCVTCYANASLLSGACTCLNGYTLATTTNRCMPSGSCHASCATCSGSSASQCTACGTNATISSGTCPCNSGYIRNTDGTQCVQCHASCTTCTGLTNTTCTACRINASLPSGVSPGTCSCNSGFYANADFTCGACSPSCMTCTAGSAASCLTCKPSTATVVSGVCVCPTGFFLSTDGSQCTACSANCLTCSGSATSCTSCNSAAQLTSSQCTCLASAYLSSTSVCTPCHLTCLTCSGSTQTSCLTCVANAALTSAACPCNVGFVRSADSTKCVACDYTCLTCSGPLSTNCMTCATNATLQSGGTCACNSGYFLQTTGTCAVCNVACLTCTGSSSSNCLTCKAAGATVTLACGCSSHQYLSSDGTQCVECDASCKTCSATGASGCQSCYPLGILTPLQGPGTCTCGSGLFYTPTTGCSGCDFTCKTCTGSAATLCTSCNTGAALVGGTSPSTCGCTAGYVLSTTGTCIACSPNCKTCVGSPQACVTCETSLAVLTGTQCQCLSSAFQSTTGQCVSCDTSCVTCSGASSASCLTCAANAFLTSSPGVCQCATGYYPNPSVTSCAACDVSCKTCSGSLSTMCTLCFTPAVLSTTNACTCPPGFYPNSDASKCAACNNTCKTCNGASASACTSCFAQAQLSATAPSTCVCQSGTVPLPTAATCGVLNCDTTCKSCSAAGIAGCTSCYPNAVGQLTTFPTSCLCASGFYANPNSANCAACDTSCLTCSSGSSLACLSCPSGQILVDQMYCSTICPAGQIAVNGYCSVPTSPLAFRLELNIVNQTLIDTVAQAQAQSSVSSISTGPTAYYQQGWLFDGASHYVMLPPTNAETTRNVLLDSSHYIELWIRPLANSNIGCLLSKYNTLNQSLNLLLQFCITDTSALLLKFTGINFSDTSVQVTNTLTGGQVSASRTWSVVAYQLQQNGKLSTTATLFINQKSVATQTFSGVLFKDFAGNVDSVKFVLGASYSSYTVFNNYFKGAIAELSIYNSLAPTTSSSSCTCSTCSRGGICLSQCYSSEYQSLTGCSACLSTCTTGCIRGTDCRTNVDPLCASFTTFVGCTTCINLATLTSTGCQCTANANYVSTQGVCSCMSGYQPSSNNCVQCLNYFSPSQVSAFYDSTFLKILIDFTLPVVTTAVSSCAQLFLSSTLQKLGTGYSCSWSSNAKEVAVLLGTNSTIVNEALYLNYVNLYSFQGNCSFSAVPLTPVAVYKFALPPVVAKLICPKTFSLTCAKTDTLNFDASSSLGGKGRSLTFSWTITSIPSLVSLVQYQKYQTSLPILQIPKVSLSAAVLTVSLSVTNYLGSQSLTSSIVNITAGAAISLAIDGGTSFTVSAAVQRVVKVIPSSLCSTTNSLQYTWTLLGSVPSLPGLSFAFLANPSPPNTVAIPAYSLKPGYTYGFLVSATDGRNFGSIGWNVTIPHSQLIAVLDKTSSTINANNDFKISGSMSSDPDQTSGNLAYSWSCLETGKSCTDKTGNIVVVGQTDSSLTIPSSKLKANSSWNITLTISKDTRSASSSVTINTTASTGCEFFVSTPTPIRVNPQAILQIAYQVSTTLSTTFQWTQVFGNSLQVLTPWNYPFLLIGPNTMQSGAEYGFTLTAANSAGSAYTQIFFLANYPPSGGTSIISPTSGTALSTIYSILSSNWEDVEGDYPLSYRLTYLYYGYQVAVNTRCLSNQILIKTGIGQYQLTAEVYDTLNSKSITQLSLTSTAPHRMLQATDVLSAFQADTIDVDQTFPMVLAYSSVYTFDNNTYAGVESALETYVAQLQVVDGSVVDSCIGSVQALFTQKSQMNAVSLLRLLNFLQTVLKRATTTITDSQMGYLQTVLTQYPGTSANEISELRAFLNSQVSNSASSNLPDQTASTFSSNTLSSYQRRVSSNTLSGLKLASGSSSVQFPTDLLTSLGLDSSSVFDVQTNSISYQNSTSDQVEITLSSSGQFVSYSFVPNAQVQQVSVKNLISPITFTVPIHSYQSNLTYQCVYQSASGEWLSDGVNLTSVTATSATCNATHLSTFQVQASVATTQITPVTSAPPTQTVVSQLSCSTNYAPIGIAGAVLLFGFLLILVMKLLDRQISIEKVDISAVEVSQLQVPTKQFKGLEMINEKREIQAINSSTVTEGPVIDASPTFEKSSFLRLFLESHLLIGLCVYAPNLKRWSKVLILTSALLTEVCIVGVSYSRHPDQDAHSLSDVWTGYSSTDFKYVLVSLAVGFGVALILMTLFSLAQRKAKKTFRLFLNSFGAVLATGVCAAAVAGTVYMNLDLCFEAGGHWAMGFLPVFFGEVVVCQSLLSLGRALVLKAVN